MRILEIFDGSYPWDVRVEKVSRSLLAAGHEVALLCRNSGDLPDRERLSDGLEIFRPPASWGRLGFPFFFNPVWIAAARAAAKAVRPELLLVRDLPMTPLAVLLSRWLQVPVVADLAEPYPDSLRAHFQYQNPTLADYIVRNPRLADLVERAVLPHLDHVIVVCPEAGTRLEARGLSPARWTEVRNTVDATRFKPKGSNPDPIRDSENRFRVLFSGLLSGDRGVEIALEALARLEVESPSRFFFIVTGEGPVRSDLERRVARLSLGASVKFTGWLPYLALPDIIANCHVGLLPFHRCRHIDASLANKLFEYMLLGLPVIATAIAPMERIVVDSQCGIVVPDGDSAALAAAIRTLADDEGARRAMSSAGSTAARTLYHWGEDEKRLLSVVDSVAHGRVDLPTTGAAPLLQERRPPLLQGDSGCR